MLRDSLENTAITTPTPTWAAGDAIPIHAAGDAMSTRADGDAMPVRVVDNATPARAPQLRGNAGHDWRTVDRALRAIRQRRAALDAEEARWLREAEALQIWRPLGMVSALDYLERVLGYAPRTAQDRLRVARALGDLPHLTAALAADHLSFSAVRELTRVATPATETSWIEAAIGKNLRQIEDLVADRRPGDRPDDPPDPTACTHVVRFELSAETFALLRQARQVLDDEHGTNLADDAFVTALCTTVLDDAPATEPTGRAKFQIALTVCERCRQGWQEGAGARIAVEAATVDRALCDAQHIGSLDGAEPERVHQDIPPSVVRFVWRRDGGRCRVDGCRSARGLEVHHLVHRADGGSHDASNLILACSACHQAHHAGTLTITGTAEHLEVRRPGRSTSPAATVGTSIGAHVGAPGMASMSAHVGAPGTAARPADLCVIAEMSGAQSVTRSPEVRRPRGRVQGAVAQVARRRDGSGLGFCRPRDRAMTDDGQPRVTDRVYAVRACPHRSQRLTPAWTLRFGFFGDLIRRGRIAFPSNMADSIRCALGLAIGECADSWMTAMGRFSGIPRMKFSEKESACSDDRLTRS